MAQQIARGVRIRLAMATYPMWPSASPYRVGTPEKRISRLITRPARSPVDASTPSSRTTPDDSGPVWVANPSPYDSFIHYTSPV